MRAYSTVDGCVRGDFKGPLLWHMEGNALFGIPCLSYSGEAFALADLTKVLVGHIFSYTGDGTIDVQGLCRQLRHF